jgi:hypothetical protein
MGIEYPGQHILDRAPGNKLAKLILKVFKSKKEPVKNITSFIDKLKQFGKKHSHSDNSTVVALKKFKIKNNFSDSSLASAIKKIKKQTDNNSTTEDIIDHLSKHKESYGKAGLAISSALIAGYATKKYLNRKRE